MARSCASKALRSALREVLKGCEDGERICAARRAARPRCQFPSPRACRRCRRRGGGSALEGWTRGREVWWFGIGGLQKGESCVEQGRLVVELKSSEELASRTIEIGIEVVENAVGISESSNQLRYLILVAPLRYCKKCQIDALHPSNVVLQVSQPNAPYDHFRAKARRLH